MGFLIDGKGTCPICHEEIEDYEVPEGCTGGCGVETIPADQFAIPPECELNFHGDAIGYADLPPLHELTEYDMDEDGLGDWDAENWDGDGMVDLDEIDDMWSDVWYDDDMELFDDAEL